MGNWNSVSDTNGCGSLLLNVEILNQNLPSMDDALSLLVQFKPMLLEELDGIEQGLDQGDVETVRFHAHRIRSASLYLGLEGIGIAATRLEQLIECKGTLDELLVAWSLVRRACRGFMSKDRAEIASLLDALAKDQS